MADFEIPEEPEYNRNIRRFETTDPAHADLFNAVAQTLINNDEFLKRTVEQQKETVLEKTGDAGDTTVTFTSGDTENPEDWTEITPVESGEKQSSLWQKISLFAKNLRYLWKLCGTSDISGVADGTLTGAVSKLNTDMAGKANLIGENRFYNGTITVNKTVGVNNASFVNAQFVAESPNKLEPGSRAGYGFHNDNVTSGFLYLDNDHRLKFIDAFGGVHVIVMESP